MTMNKRDWLMTGRALHGIADEFKMRVPLMRGPEKNAAATVRDLIRKAAFQACLEAHRRTKP